MDIWKEKKLDWAAEVRYWLELANVSIKELADYLEINYSTLRSKLRRGISNTERDSLVKCVGLIADNRE